MFCYKIYHIISLYLGKEKFITITYRKIDPTKYHKFAILSSFRIFWELIKTGVEKMSRSSNDVQ